MNEMQSRLARVRRRLRFIVSFRGTCWLAAAGLAMFAVAGLLDWQLHLPALVRAILLVGILSGVTGIAYRHLFGPLLARADDLTLALQVEARYPALNDSLASTVEFLKLPADTDGAGSPQLRRHAVERTLRQAEGYDFFKIVDRRGMGPAGLSLLGAGAMAAALLVLFPAQSATALARLVNPFGSKEWPPQTILEIDPSTRNHTRMARGEPFEIRAMVRGVIPERATVLFWFGESSPPAEQTYLLNRSEDGNTAALSARLEPGRAQRHFRFQVRANDAVYGPQEVRVLPPPMLVPLDGRPSPQVRLRYPEYTDLPPADLPDGTSHIEAVAGTVVSLRAATDRAVVRSWMEYRPDQPLVPLALLLGPLGAQHPEALAPTSVADMASRIIPVHLGENGQRMETEFRPWFTGTYALRFEDETGLGNTRLFDIQVQADPAPAVNLERPSASQDSLAVLPHAEITVKVIAEDSQYAVRSVYLEYRCKKDDPPRKLLQYEHRSTGTMIPQLLAAVSPAPIPVATPPLRLRLQRLDIATRLSLRHLKHLDGSGLKEGDLVTLQACADDFDDVAVDKQPGHSHEVELRIVSHGTLDNLLNQAQAQMQQELVRLREQQRDARGKVETAQKQWRQKGKLRPEDLDKLLQAEQLQQQIRGRVGTRQEGLRAEVAKVLQTLRDNQLPRSDTHERMELLAAELDRLAREDLEQIEPLLTEARKQTEITGQLGQDKARQAAEQEQQAQQKEQRAEQLDEQARQAGEPEKSAALQQQADQVRKEAQKTRQAAQALRVEAKALENPGKPDQDAKNPLNRAIQHQDEVEKTFSELLSRLEPWSSTREVKGEARNLLLDQRQLGVRTEGLDKDIPRGSKLEELRPEQAEKLRQAMREQERLADRAEQLLSKLNRLAGEKERFAQEKEQKAREKLKEATAKNLVAQKKPNDVAKLREEARELTDEAKSLQDAASALQEEANTLRQAEQLGRQADANLQAQMKKAAESLQKAELGNASNAQEQSIQSLENIVKALENRREDELDRLIKKMRDAEKKLAEIKEEQERLQKKVNAAKQLADPKEREAELKRLAREQEKLRKQAQELAKHLLRMRAERAGQALNRASGRMAEAGQEMDEGRDAQEDQEDTLDRLEEAQQELKQAREEVEEELAREKLDKIADQIRRLKERQEALITDTARVHGQVLQAKGFGGTVAPSLLAMARGQEGLGQETASLADGNLSGAEVFARILGKSAEAMKQAAERMQKRLEETNPRNPDAAVKFDVKRETIANEGTERLQRDALRLLEQLLDALKPEKGIGGGQAAGGGQGGGAKSGPESDGIPHLAQLKALKVLQEDVNRRTEAFAKKYPDPTKLTKEQKAELATLRSDQAEIAELLDKLITPDNPEGDKK